MSIVIELDDEGEALLREAAKEVSVCASVGCGSGADLGEIIKRIARRVLAERERRLADE